MPSEPAARSRKCGLIPPLLGHTVAITGDRRAEELAAHITGLGASVLHGPVLRTRTSADDGGDLWAATAAVIACPPEYLLATTAIGMRTWFDAAAAWGLLGDLLEAFTETRIVARGTKVAGAVVAAGLVVWRTETSARTEAAVAVIADRLLDGARVAVQLPGDPEPSADALRRLEATGTNVMSIRPYRLESPADPGTALRLVHAVAETRVSAVTFTSRAGVRRFAGLAAAEGVLDDVGRALGEDGGVLAAAVGPSTAAEVAAALDVTACFPNDPSIGALVETLVGELRVRGHHHLEGTFGSDIVVQGRLVDTDGRSVWATEREAALLAELVRSPRRVVSAHLLREAVWRDGEVEPSALETTIARLRRRLDGTGLKVETVRRRGYVLAVDVVDCPTLPPPADPNLSTGVAG